MAQARHGIEDLQSRHYDVWCRMVLAPNDPALVALKSKLAKDIETLRQRQADAAKTAAELQKNLERRIAQLGLAVRLDLSSGQPFHEPDDPVLAIDGVPLNQLDATVTRHDLPHLKPVDLTVPDLGSGRPPLTTSTKAEEIANHLSGQALIAQLDAYKRNPDIEASAERPFTPLAAIWDAEVTPAPPDPDALLAPKPGTLTPTGATKTVEQTRYLYGVMTPLHNGTARVVATRAHTEHRETLRDAAKHLVELRIDGAHMSRHLLVPGLRIALPDPARLGNPAGAPGLSPDNTVQQSAPAIAPVDTGTPDNHSFALAATQSKLQSVRLIDGFGRGIRLQQAAQTESPPRLSHPARIAAGWLTAVNSAGSVADPHGWFAFNHVDHSLAVYDGDGLLLGALLPVTEIARGFIWSPPPGDPQSADFYARLLSQGTQTPDFSAIADPVLRDWITALMDLEQKDVTIFLDRMVAPAMLTHSHGDATGALISAPFALVSAKIAVEFPGLTPPASDLPVPQVYNRDLDEHPAIAKIGVRLGQVIQTPEKLVLAGDDGLVAARWDGRSGFARADFMDADDQPASNALHTDPLPVPVGGGAVATEAPTPGQIVQMLVDPGKPVRLRSGVLPDTHLQPAVGLIRRMQALGTAHFAVGPVLSRAPDAGKSTAAPRIPVPSDDYGKWSWHTRPDLRSWDSGTDLKDIPKAQPLFEGATRLSDGWLSLTSTPIRAFHCLSGQEVDPGSVVRLVWDVAGVRSVGVQALDADGNIDVLIPPNTPIFDVAPRIDLRIDTATEVALTVFDATGAKVAERRLQLIVKETDE